ncbi:hypothetical protein [Massilia sp.]|uniref:hypothetical protein n=1 Tax=Massilia sp. TaxID=1882437 RepID=UPI00391AFE5E
MKIRFLLPAIFPLMLSGAALAAEQTRTPPPVMKIHNLAGAFAEVWDRNMGKPDEDFVRDFKASVGARFPAFYGVERYRGKKTEAQRDADIVAARAAFPALRPTYLKTVANFERDMTGYIASFRKVFPDYAAQNDVWFVHSLGEMDGGKRTLNGKTTFIFGADRMSEDGGKDANVLFFHHELVHDYQPLECKQWPIWTSLWQEGLATYIALQLNPGWTVEGMLPPEMVEGTRRQMERAVEDLYAKLDSTNRDDYSGLFLGAGDKTGMPARRGYYLGVLVAEEAAKKMDLQQLTKLPCEEVRPVVVAAVEHLRSKQAAARK